MTSDIEGTPVRGIARRLPRWLEFEIAKLLGTLGFKTYSSLLWDLASRTDEPEPAPADPISEKILAQIKHQARHDPSVLAAGETAIPILNRSIAAPMQQRYGVDVSALFGDMKERPEVLCVVPALGDLHDETCVFEIMTALHALGARSFMTIVTEQTAEEAGAIESSGPSSVAARTIFWRDHCSGESAIDPRLLSIYLRALGPAVVVVNGSRLGLRAVARYGPALMHLHRMFCTFGLSGLPEAKARRDIGYLCATALYATALTDDPAMVGVLNSYLSGQKSMGLAVLPPPSGADMERVAAIFGTDFADRRPKADSDMVTALLAARPGAPPRVAPSKADAVDNRRPSHSIDITATIVFHREGPFVVPALASLMDMIDAARDAGLTVEARAILDKADDQTRHLVATHGAGLDDIAEVSFGDLGLARNAGAARARGTFLAFLDGDDLWGSLWLRLAHRAATAPDAPCGAIWHPEDVYGFSEADFDFHAADGSPHPAGKSAHLLLRSSTAPWFDPRDLLLENLWNSNAFTRTATFLKYPYRAADWVRHWGYEDWMWNLETLRQGIPHIVVPDTVQIYRLKETNSLASAGLAKGLLPVLQ